MIRTPQDIEVAGVRLWVPVTDDLHVHADSLRWLHHLRTNGHALSGLKSYAEGVALFLEWNEHHSFPSYLHAARHLEDFQALLNTEIITRGKGKGKPRGFSRKTVIMDAVRSFLLYLVSRDELPNEVIGLLYEINKTTPLPSDLALSVTTVAKPRHRFSRDYEEMHPPTLTREEMSALLLAAENRRDILLLVLLRVTGVRIGEAVGARLADMHMSSARYPGCRYREAVPHIHVKRREDNANDAVGKSKRPRIIPAGLALYNAYNAYTEERMDILGAHDTSPFLFVNLYAEPRGQALKPRSGSRIVRRIADRAGVDAHAHLLRHTMASVAINDDDIDLEVIQKILGHAQLTTTGIYVHPDERALQAAVDAAGSDLDTFLLEDS